MKKILAACLILVCSSPFCESSSKKELNKDSEGYTLKQVVIFSRHGLRSPIQKEYNTIKEATPKKIPEWTISPGEITPKGIILSLYMGSSIGHWLEKNGLIKKHECPDSNAVYVYTNSLERTIATGQALALGAFPACNIPVKHNEKINVMDPFFDISFDAKKEKFYPEWNQWIEKNIKDLNLQKQYRKLEKILNFRESPSCKSIQNCTLEDKKNTFKLFFEKEEFIKGSLAISKDVVNFFTLEYYQGFPKKEIAWGEVLTSNQWAGFSKIFKKYNDTLFSFPPAAKKMSYNFFNYLKDVFINIDESNPQKLALLVGHDINIEPIITALNPKPYNLYGQYERNPIGGNLQFQRWQNKESGEMFFKLEYVYQSKDQLRNATELTEENPPHRVALHLKECPVNAQGFCSWKDFKTIIDKLYDEESSKK